MKRGRITGVDKRVLLLLGEHPDGLLGQELVDRGAVPNWSVYHVLDRLEEAGLIESRPEPRQPGYEGKLRDIFTLTEKGRQLTTEKFMIRTYIGAKIIRAEPQNHPTDGREGYAVYYPDGYTSWSPKETFENAYREVTQGEAALVAAQIAQTE